MKKTWCSFISIFQYVNLLLLQTSPTVSGQSSNSCKPFILACKYVRVLNSVSKNKIYSTEMATQLKIAVATFLVLCIVFEDARLVLAGKRRKSKYI